jgi:hypothetical protein
LNRLLARTLLRTCLIEWTASVVLMLGVGLLWDFPRIFMLAHFTLMCAMLVFCGWPLRDHARDSGTPQWLMLLALAPVLIAASVAFLGGGQYWVWAALLAASLLFIRRRYRAMLAAPPAFPAGRLQAQ